MAITLGKIAAAWAAMGQIIDELRHEPDFELRLFGLGFTAGASCVIDEHQQQLEGIVAAAAPTAPERPAVIRRLRRSSAADPRLGRLLVAAAVAAVLLSAFIHLI